MSRHMKSTLMPYSLPRRELNTNKQSDIIFITPTTKIVIFDSQMRTENEKMQFTLWTQLLWGPKVKCHYFRLSKWGPKVKCHYFRLSKRWTHTNRTHSNPCADANINFLDKYRCIFSFLFLYQENAPDGYHIFYLLLFLYRWVSCFRCLLFIILSYRLK